MCIFVYVSALIPLPKFNFSCSYIFLNTFRYSSPGFSFPQGPSFRIEKNPIKQMELTEPT